MKLRLGIPKGSLQDATIQLFQRAGYIVPRRLAIVLSVDRRSRDRVHADSRAGNGALRRRRRARCRPHRPGLDRRARDRSSRTGAAGADLRSRLLEAEFRQGRAGCWRRRKTRRSSPLRTSNGKRIATELVRVTKHYFTTKRAQRRRRVLVGRHRSEAAGAGRRDRRGDRDRLDTARQPASHHRNHHGIEHAADCAIRRPWPIRGRRPRSKTSPCC